MFGITDQDNHVLLTISSKSQNSCNSEIIIGNIYKDKIRNPKPNYKFLNRKLPHYK